MASSHVVMLEVVKLEATSEAMDDSEVRSYHAVM